MPMSGISISLKVLVSRTIQGQRQIRHPSPLTSSSSRHSLDAFFFFFSSSSFFSRSVAARLLIVKALEKFWLEKRGNLINLVSGVDLKMIFP